MIYNCQPGRKEGTVSQDPAGDPHQNGSVISILKWGESGYMNLKPQALLALPAYPLYPKSHAKPFMLDPTQSSQQPCIMLRNLKPKVDKHSVRGHITTELQNRFAGRSGSTGLMFFPLPHKAL